MGKREPNRRRKGWRYTTAFRPRANVDGRRWEAQAFQHWLTHYQDRLGGELSEDQVAKCRDLALIAVSCERQQEALARGQDVDTVAYGQALGHRARLERELFGPGPEDGEVEERARHPSEIPPPPGPFQFDLSLLTELELDWLEVAFETALERTRTGYDPFGAHGEMAIFQALRRIATGHGRAVDFWQAGNIKHYAWLVKKAALKVPFPLFFGGYHVEPEPVEIDHPSYPPDPIEPEEGETVGFVEDPLPGIPPPADRLPAPQKALPAPESEPSIEGEYLPPREPRPIVHPSVMSAARRGTIGDGYDD